jgi:hypothetical protein
VSLAAFDQTLAEDPSINRMIDSAQPFNAIRDNPLLSNPNMSFVVFLNKKDLFEEKLQKTQIAKYFPNFEGNLQDFCFKQVMYRLKLGQEWSSIFLQAVFIARIRPKINILSYY